MNPCANVNEFWNMHSMIFYTTRRVCIYTICTPEYEACILLDFQLSELRQTLETMTFVIQKKNPHVTR